jgi:cell division septation protein DedD
VSELSHDADDAFHEIQLSGKQLVFLFMATTVVSVVIFLCGVLVGRGVRPEGPAPSGTSAALTQAPPPGQAATSDAPPQPAAGSAGPQAAEPPTPSSDAALSYPNRLQSDKPVAERLKPQTEAASTAPRAEPVVRDVAPPRPEPPAQPAAEKTEPPPAAAPPASAATASGTWAVQVVSLRDRGAAARIADRLKGKGYPAFLVSPPAGAPAPLFKVQVGRYNDRREADQISARLRKEERFDTWIVR